MAGVRATLQDMVDTGVISVEEAAGRSVGYARQYASAKIAQITKQDPVLAVSVLRGAQPDQQASSGSCTIFARHLTGTGAPTGLDMALTLLPAKMARLKKSYPA